MITLHHLEHSRSFRILWALEELALDYDMVYYRRLPNLSAPPELKKVHPLGKAPILTDDGQTIVESAVILNYLQDRYDAAQQFAPASPSDRQHYDYWMHYAEGSLMPYLVFGLVMEQLGGPAVPRLARPLTRGVGQQVKRQFVNPRLADQVAFVEQHLTRQPYFCGDQFSFADIQMTFALQGVCRALPDQPLPAIRQFLQRVTIRPAYQRATQKSPDGGRLM